MASCCMPGRSSTALFTRTAKLDPWAHSARCTWAMAIHHAVGISRQRNSGYRPSRVNIMAQGLSTPDTSLSPAHLSIRRSRTTTHYTHHLMVSRIGRACEAGLSTGMRRERVSPQIRKKERKKVLSGRQPMTKSDQGCESACTGCQSLHPPSPFIIITQPESWYSFYCPTESRRLSRPSWLVTYRDGLPAHRRSPIRVLTRSDVAQLHWSMPTRYH